MTVLKGDLKLKTAGWIPCITLMLISGLGITVLQAQTAYSLTSPDNTISVDLTVGNILMYTVTVDGRRVLESSRLSMTINDGTMLGADGRVINTARQTINQIIRPFVPEKNSTITDHCNELILEFEGGYVVIFRAYNNGVAYRFRTGLGESLLVQAEEVVLNFPDNSRVYFPEEESQFSHNERSYRYLPMDSVSTERLASLPLLVETGGLKVLVTESALENYPGMWVTGGDEGTLNGFWAHYPLRAEPNRNSDRNVPVVEEADYLALTDGDRSFPWRIMAIAKTDADLITNQLTYQLADENRIDDPSWISPGQVAWDWWNAWNIYYVSFRSGINTGTYKYYIDFASEHGIEYIILDEGWSSRTDLLDIVPDIDLQQLLAYGREKDVGIILWMTWYNLDDQIEEAFERFEEWGVKGVKVDFMQRDDQWMVDYYWKVAEAAAEHKLLVDFHGAYKPAGLRRAYPNVITREGVMGLEHNKWSRDITPEHNLTLPFIRMVAGPMDYTPGAMLNASSRTFQIVYDRPMSMGTRVHQLAMYVVYESPLQMLADSPTNYLREPESVEFITSVPTVWDETVVLEAAVADYLVLARRSGDQWFIGGMTDEEAREFTIPLSFLDGRAYMATMISDGVNVDRYAGDYTIANRTVSRGEEVIIHMAPGGGWAARFTPR